MIELYVYSAGGWMVQTLNGIAAFCSSPTFKTLIRWGLMLSVLVSVYIWTKKRDLQLLINFFLIFMFIPTILVGVKKSVQVIDVSNITEVKKIDNVPLGLAAPIGLLSSMGYAIARGYEIIVAQPADALQFSKTGLMFGSKIVSKSTSFDLMNPAGISMFNDYVKSCVVLDIYLSHKYSLQQLMNSTEPYDLIFANPSPLRGIFVDGAFQTCQVAARNLQTMLVSETNVNGTTFTHYARKLFPNRADAAPLLGQMMGDSYSYFMQSGRTASEIMRQNVTMNALRNGLISYGSANNATAGMVSLAGDMAAQRQMIQNSTGAMIATQYLPLLHTIFFAILIGIFPFMVVMASINTLSMRVVRMYIMALGSLQLWPIAFAICNGAMVWFLKADSPTGITLSNMSQLQQQHAMAGSMAGWLMTSIPVICWGVMSGIGGIMSTAASTFVASDTGAAAQSAGRVAEGNYAFNNMQMENVQGNKWDTNRSYAAGANTQQLENGAMVTQTAGGAMVANTAPAMSNLATNINFTKMQQSMAQQQYRQSESETQTRLEGWRSDSAQTFQQLQSFAHRHGDNFSRGIDSREGSNSQVSEGTQKMMDAVQSYARSHGVSEAVAFSELERKSKEGFAEVSAGFKAFGTGGSTGARAANGSEASASQTGNADETNRTSNDARLSQSFSEGWSMVKSASYDKSASQVESDGMDQLKQVQQSMQQTDSHYQDYNHSKAHTEELSRMASMSDSESATVSSNLSQEFVSWMQGRNPAEAQQLLTNTDSAENREQLAQYANEFVSERVKGRMEQHNQTALAGGETGFQTNPQYVSGRSAQEQSQPVTQSGVRGETGGQVNPLHVPGQPAQEQNHPVTLSSENKPYSQPTQVDHSGSAVESLQSGASRPAEAPQPFNSAKQFEDARNAMQSESNPFRQDVVAQQQQNQSTIDQNGANQGSQKELIEAQTKELKNDVSNKSNEVGEDIRKAQEHQQHQGVKNPADLRGKTDELLPPKTK
ncbi:conjugal transfer mating-pair stabilization protein TraG [Citrobacter sedlakii]|uniref:conjugal transfer mating-pair stabilization protein TraG n=1 Tax=Citrobacter sedlakii TaxID=67826 RepID=UPI00200B44D9|nr:conjugal transfer mating-pair stabilization protein TraG [Citrobacter sedlakii]MCK8148028.1 conjugal transfer mating pair stabilization protein TraG [Citrobacter sedlakii]